MRDRAILELLYAAGLRVSELTGLNVADLSLDAGRALLRGKGDKERIVPLGRASIVALEKYLQNGRPALVKKPMRPPLSFHARHAAQPRLGVAPGEAERSRRQSAHAAPQLRHAYGRARRGSAHGTNAYWVTLTSPLRRSTRTWRWDG